MKHSAFRQVFYQRLTHKYKQGELQALYHWCVKEIEGWSRTQAYLHDDDAIADIKRWETVVERLLQDEPVQYIFGRTTFFNLDLQVDKRALIPRPETEELVSLILLNEGLTDLEVLDIGTGSGCIALALKSARPQWKLRACDLSNGALELARMNAALLHLPIEWFQCDILMEEKVNHSGDVWVSNPPYIPMDRSHDMATRVLEYEPHMALFEQTPLEFFKAILGLADASRVKRVYFETHAQEMHALSELADGLASKPTYRFHKDLSGKERFFIVNFENR